MKNESFRLRLSGENLFHLEGRWFLLCLIDNSKNETIRDKGFPLWRKLADAEAVASD